MEIKEPNVTSATDVLIPADTKTASMRERTAMKRALIIAGGRDYKPIQAHVDVLNKVVKELRIDKIVEGGAKGADRYAKLYAEHYGIECQEVPAEWDKYGTPAGPLRNLKMALLPDVVAVFLFPGGAGTSNMKKRAIQCKLPVYDTEYKGETDVQE